MKIRVTAYVGNRRTFWDFSGESDDEVEGRAKRFAETLVAMGFRRTSKAGVVTFTLPHRITKITVRKLKA